ncbi:MAG: hypothetical protein IT304_10965 [Dehalococcoidia bacterium]|nr:hypothetical protein [Dehalococcoidia bacterium]
MTPRLSRRRLLGVGVALGATTAACSDGGARPSPATPSPPQDAQPSTTTTVFATPTVLNAPPRGGTARVVAARSFTFDTFDAQRAGEPSVLEVLGRTHSRLVRWTDFQAGRVGADLAEAWESPDPLTLVLHLDRGARWQDRPPLDGRPVTADDVVAHLRRTLDLTASVSLPSAQRAGDYATIARASAPTPDQVVVELRSPDALLLVTLAGRFALIQPAAAVAAFERRWPDLDAGAVVGTGPFVFDGWGQHGSLTFRRHSGAHLPPLLDAITVVPPGNVLERFRTGDLDEVITRDRRDAAAVRALPGSPHEAFRYEATPIVSTLFTGAPPWDNPELRRALSGALHRATLAVRLFGGRAAASAPVAPAYPGFALSESALASYQGYGDPEHDARDARARWAAAGGPALGPVTIDFPSIFDPLYSASTVVTGILNEVLGAGQFRAAIETYTAISAKAVDRRYGSGQAAFWWGWGPPFTEPDPSRVLAETYATGSPGADTLGPPPVGLDALLARMVAEPVLARRQDLARDAARLLLDAGAGGQLDWLVQRAEVFRWPRLSGPPPTPFESAHLDVTRFVTSSAAP